MSWRMGDILRKGLIFVLLLLMVFIGGSQFFLLPLASQTAAARFKAAVNAAAASATIWTDPAILVLSGQFDKVELSAENARLGQVMVQHMDLTGKNVHLGLSSMLGGEFLSVQSADELKLTGTVSETTLKELLQNKVDKLESLEVHIAADKVSASGQVKLGGRMADVVIEGRAFEEDGSIYFKMSKLDIKNALLGKAVLQNFFGDILLVDFKKLPWGIEVDDVVQQDGAIVIMASRHNK